ncbi:MAG: type II secretion system protein [Candidatus Wallbacteria bacterium]|nr:type II secretion system protein [Candidatus Wallbacteria bacterium]
MNGRGRRGMTVVELMVAVLLFSVMSGVLWNLWIGGNRSFEDSSSHASAFRSASLALEWMRRDLARVAVARPRPPFGQATGPVRLGAGGEVEIAVFAELEKGELKESLSELEAETVTYRFQGAPGAGHGFRRNGRLLAGIELERFSVQPMQDAQSGAPFVKVTAVGIDPSGRKSVMLTDLVYLEQLHKLRKYPWSMPNPVPRVGGWGSVDPNA